MPIEVEGAPPRLPPRRWVRIEGIEALTPRVLRLTLGGDDLRGFQPALPGGHAKLILPPAGATRPAIPLRYEEGRPVFEEGAVPPFLRTYTPLRFDSDRLRVEVELLLHGDGLASTWAQRAKVGDEVVLAGPRGGWDVPQDGDWYVVAADDTAIPAATQVIAALPVGRPRTVLFEVVDEAERRALPEVAAEDATWCYRGEDTSRAGAPLEATVRDLALDSGRGYVWVACEANAMRRIRRHLLEDRGLPSDRLVTRGYWKRGAADHPDGDYGQDDLGHGH